MKQPGQALSRRRRDHRHLPYALRSRRRAPARRPFREIPRRPPRRPGPPGGEAVSYFGANETIRTGRHRLIRHNNGKKKPAYELYDHNSPEKETQNIADGNPDLVRDLAAKLDAKLGK